MELWDQPLEMRIAAAQARLLVERCQYLRRLRESYHAA